MILQPPFPPPSLTHSSLVLLLLTSHRPSVPPPRQRVIGWFSCRRNSTNRPSMREKVVHRRLTSCLTGVPCEGIVLYSRSAHVCVHYCEIWMHCIDIHSKLQGCGVRYLFPLASAYTTTYTYSSSSLVCVCDLYILSLPDNTALEPAQRHWNSVYSSIHKIMTPFPFLHVLCTVAERDRVFPVTLQLSCPTVL